MLSPDGKFLWTGEEWIPAPPVQSQSSEDRTSPLESASSDIEQPYGEDSPAISPPYSNPVTSLNRDSSLHTTPGEDYAIQQSGEALGLATTVAGRNGVVLLAIAFTAYSVFKADGSNEAEWVVGNDYLVLKALVAAWVIGIILSVYSRVKSAPVQDVETQEQIRILNKTSTVLLALPLLPIALIMLFFYLSMKYGNTGTHRY